MLQQNRVKFAQWCLLALFTLLLCMYNTRLYCLPILQINKVANSVFPVSIGIHPSAHKTIKNVLFVEIVKTARLIAEILFNIPFERHFWS
jgi:hypothetical protein